MRKKFLLPVLLIAFLLAGCTKENIVTSDNSDPYSQIVIPSDKEYHSHMKITQIGGRRPKVLLNTDYNFNRWNCEGQSSPAVHFNLDQTDGDSLKIDYLIIWNASTHVDNLSARYTLYCDSTNGWLNKYDIELPYSYPIGSRGWIARSHTIPTNLFANLIGPYGVLNLVDDGDTGVAGYGAGILIRLGDEFNNPPMILLNENIFSPDYYESPIYTIHSKKLDVRTSYILIDGQYKYRFLTPNDADQAIYKIWDGNDNLLTTIYYCYSDCTYGPNSYHYYWNNINANDFLSYISPESVYKLQMIINKAKK